MFSLAGLCLISAPARAAEPIPAWNGFYAGALLGYGFGQATTNLKPDSALSTVIFPPFFISNLETRPRGITGGVEAGYRHQSGSVVAGVATDFSFASMSDAASGTARPFLGGTANTSVESKLNWYGTLRAKLGVLPSENLLVYATAGLAYANVSTTTTASNLLGCPGRFYCGSGTAGGVSTGPVVGGGIEYAFQPRWTLKAEYLTTWFDQSNTFAQLPFISGSFNGNYTADTTFKLQTVRLGIAYSFGP